MPRFDGDFLFCWTAIEELLQTRRPTPLWGGMILCLSFGVKRNSKLFRALLHFLAFMTLAAPAFAQVYKWVDERGVTHYGERPPQGGKASEVPNRLASPAAGGAGGSQENSQSNPPQGEIP